LREGVADRMLRQGRALLPLLGWSEKRRREFLLLRNPVEQAYFWRPTLDSLRWRWAVDALLSKFVLGLIYAGALLAPVPRNFGTQIRSRLQRGWASHSNVSNPYAWRLLLGESPCTEPSPAGRDAVRVRRRRNILGVRRRCELRRVFPIQYH
jgi:hypothetical protein